ncbi:MAG: hypothetical protein M3N19_12315, partial [Candidatus Eremiobacteraeota bacterium]|nr:hypothetical protein [Candidatus Eremiobacteraeota bacterium]
TYNEYDNAGVIVSPSEGKRFLRDAASGIEILVLQRESRDNSMWALATNNAVVSPRNFAIAFSLQHSHRTAHR